MKRISTILSYLFGVLFIVSSLSKLISLQSFEQVVTQMIDMFGLNAFSGYGKAVAVTVCVLELMLGIVCLMRPFRRLSGWLCLLAMLIFTCVTYLNYISPYGGVESCGCFGELFHLNPLQSFLKNIVLLLLSLVYVALSSERNQGREGIFRKERAR